MSKTPDPSNRIFRIGNAAEYSVSTEVENSGLGRSLIYILFFQGLRRQILFQVLLIYNAFRSIPEPPTPTEQTKERLEFALGPHTLLEAETGLALTLMREIFSS
jgi:hypothetical protein